jgi:hypothetical protein
MNLDSFDNIKLNDTGNIITKNPIEEAKRLANDLRSKKSYSYLSPYGVKIDVPSYKGFDIETCELKEILKYLDDKSIRKSKSIIMFLYRVISLRFPNELSKRKDKVDARFKKEIEMIESNSKNDIYWLGEVGFQNMVSYTDKSIFNNRLSILKKKNDMIQFNGNGRRFM